MNKILIEGTFEWAMKKFRAGYAIRHSSWEKNYHLMPDVEYTFEFVPPEIRHKYETPEGKFLMPTDGWELYKKKK
jgi:hypothetical protein